MVFTILLENASGKTPSLGDLQTWANQFGCTFPILQAADRVGITYGTPGVPTNFIIDQDMVIRYKVAGYDPDGMMAMVLSLLNRPTATPEATATPISSPTSTPTPFDATPTPSSTPGQYPIEFTFDISDTYFQTGDSFWLKVNLTNASDAQSVDLYTVLQVYDMYFFYPTWAEDIDSETITVPGYSPLSLTVLGPFTWPAVEGTVTGLAFIGAVMQPSTYTILSEPAFIDFGYGP